MTTLMSPNDFDDPFLISTARPARSSWLKDQLTLPNLVIVIVASIGVGGYLQVLRDHDTRLARLEAARTADAAIYQAKETQQEQMRLIEWRLANIEAELTRLRERRQ